MKTDKMAKSLDKNSNIGKILKLLKRSFEKMALILKRNNKLNLRRKYPLLKNIINSPKKIFKHKEKLKQLKPSLFLRITGTFVPFNTQHRTNIPHYKKKNRKMS